jgi:hypothetical protein
VEWPSWLRSFSAALGFTEYSTANEIKRGGHGICEKELFEEMFELALQNDMNYLG